MDKSIPDQVCDLAVKIAQDDSHGYSQINRDGNPDYDCSSLVIYCWTACGVDVRSRGATYTGNMLQAFLQSGFRKVDPVTESLQRGDVLLNVIHHTALYIGDNQIVQATIAETGTTHGHPGDQTGKEIGIFPYYDYPWDYVLRYENNPAQVINDYISYFDSDCQSTMMPMINRSDYGPAVCAMQGALKYHGFYNGSVTGLFNEAVERALKEFQRVHRLTIDGICGPETWNELMFWR